MSPGDVSLDDSPTTILDKKNNEYSFSIPIYTLGDDDIKISDNKSFKTMCSDGNNTINSNEQTTTLVTFNGVNKNGFTNKIKKKNPFKKIFDKRKNKVSSRTLNIKEQHLGLPPVSNTQFSNKNSKETEDKCNCEIITPLPNLSVKNYASTNGTNNTEATMLNHTSSTKSSRSTKSISSTAQSERTIYNNNSNPRQKRSNSDSSKVNKNTIIDLYDIPPNHDIKIKKRSSKIILNNEMDSNKIYNNYSVW